MLMASLRPSTCSSATARLADGREEGVLQLLGDAVDDAAQAGGEQRRHRRLDGGAVAGAHRVDRVLEVHGRQQTCVRF